MDDPLVETWAIHNRIDLYLLDAIPDEVLGATINDKGRSVRDQFAHIHNVRLMWLKLSAPELLEGLEKVDAKANPDRTQLRAALVASGEAIGTLIGQASRL